MKLYFARLLAAAVLLIFSVNTVVYYLYFDISEIKDKVSSAAGFFHSHKETIVLEKRDFVKEGEDEIWLKGKLYDIVACKVIDDKVYVTVYNDENEEQLINNNTKHFQQNADYKSGTGSDRSAKKQVVFDETNKVLPKINCYSFTRFIDNSTDFPSTSFRLLNTTKIVFTPPPDHLNS